MTLRENFTLVQSIGLNRINFFKLGLNMLVDWQKFVDIERHQLLNFGTKNQKATFNILNSSFASLIFKNLNTLLVSSGLKKKALKGGEETAILLESIAGRNFRGINFCKRRVFFYLFLICIQVLGNLDKVL